jgi:DNA-binding transcriptional regulator YiaG
MELGLDPPVPLDRSARTVDAPLCVEGEDMATGDQVRAARALIKMEAKELAELADVSTATLRRFEGGAKIHRKALRDILLALEAKGIEFIGLRGVQLKDEPR